MDPVVTFSLVMNSSNASEFCLKEKQPASITVFLCLVFITGLLLNTFSIWTFCCRVSCWTSGTTLQFHLALSDAIATPVTPMIAMYFTMGNNWFFGQFLCQVKIALLNLHFYGSTIFLTLISIHRYMLVVQFKKRSHMKRKEFVRKLCTGVWILLVIQAVLFAFLLPLSKEGQHNQCLSIYQKNLTNTYFVLNFVLLIVGFLLPLIVSVFCYSRLAISLTRLNTSTAKGLKVKEKSQQMIGLCLMIFVVCFLPMNVVRTIAVVLKKYYPHKCSILHRMETAYYTSWILAGVNSCLDPLLYCFGSQSFRDAFRSFRIGQRNVPNISDSDMTASHDHHLRSLSRTNSQTVCER